MTPIGFIVGSGVGVGALLTQKSFATTLSLSIAAWKRFAADDARTSARVSLGVTASLVGLLVSALLRFSLPLSVLLVSAAVVISLVVQDHSWNREISSHEFLVALSTPAWLDMCSLCLNAGLFMRQALMESLESAQAEVRSAWGLITSSENEPPIRIIEKIGSTATDNVTKRVSASLLVALERGTPVADVLASLSSELRSENRRQLLEIAAKKDVTMMLPVVFGILPAVTAIALFPAFQTLTSLH